MLGELLAAILWLKGTTHVHTSASDGDTAPAAVAQWYRERGYHFIVVTDHDKVTPVSGSRLPVSEAQRSTTDTGNRQPETGFLVIPGEEVTDRLPKKPLHVNGIGLREAVKPQGGANVVEVLQRNVDAVRAAGGLAAINHPNFGWAITTEELLRVERFHFLEIASGHPLVNMAGPPSVESMWDALLTKGRRVWAIAVDDSHHFVCPPPASAALPGQAWIVVRAEKRALPDILAAMERGDFYASTGPELEYATGEELVITIKAEGGARYRTQFIGRGGRVLRESSELVSRYRIRGNEGYVRAKVIDSNGKMAWTQPTFAGSSAR